MPIKRVFTKGFSIAIRARGRAIIFIFLFIIATMTTILQTSRIYSYETNDLIRLKGVVLNPTTILTADKLDNKLSDIYTNARVYLSGIYVVYGLVLLDNQVMIVSVKDYRGLYQSLELPWVVTEFKPTTIIEGRYITSKGEALIGTDFSLSFEKYGFPLTTKLSVGDVLTFTSGTTEISVKIVGVVESDLSELKTAGGLQVDNIIFVNWETFSDIAVNIARISGPIESSSRIYVLRVILIAKGSAIYTLLGGDMFKNRENIKEVVDNSGDKLRPLERALLDEITPGVYQSSVFTLILSLIFEIFIAGIYAWILIRFRRKDIATLRALGWDAGHLRAFVVGEFSGTLITGFLIGVIIGGLYALIIERLPLDILPYLFVLIANLVVPLLIGIKSTSRGVIKVPPLEAFRRA